MSVGGVYGGDENWWRFKSTWGYHSYIILDLILFISAIHLYDFLKSSNFFMNENFFHSRLAWALLNLFSNSPIFILQTFFSLSLFIIVSFLPLMLLMHIRLVPYLRKLAENFNNFFCILLVYITFILSKN